MCLCACAGVMVDSHSLHNPLPLILSDEQDVVKKGEDVVKKGVYIGKVC